MIDINILYEIEEYAAAGLYEGANLNLPFERMFGLAYRRLYENMPVRVHETQLLMPFEPVYQSKTSFGDAMNNGLRSSGIDGSHHAKAYILNIFHSDGLEINLDIAEEKKVKYPQYADFIDELIKDLRKYIKGRGQYIHSNPDIETIVKHGFNYIKQNLANEIELAQKENDVTGLNILLALKDFEIGIDVHFNKIKQALFNVSELSVERQIISDEFAKCFYEPAQSFIGGLLAVNLVWMLDGCDSIGRIDYVLGDLFERDITNGSLDINLARKLLDNLWQEYERMNGWNLQIGGITPEGNNCYNLLTQELLLCNTRNKVRRPNLALRVTKDMPDNIFNLALDSIIAGTGKPVLYNDELYIKTLMELFPELTREDAARYGFGGCTETMISGLSCVDSLGGGINLAHLLELAINGGILFKDLINKNNNKNLMQYETFEELMCEFKKYIDEASKNTANYGNAQSKRRTTEGDPKIARTMFTADCIKNRRSFEAGGARYNWNVTSYDGSTVVIDSLYAIKHLVYDTKKISREVLYNALKNNFVGQEYEEVRELLLNAPKFGNDIEEVDNLANEVLSYAWNKLLSFEETRGLNREHNKMIGRFTPSVILFATYENAGKNISATANGRRAFEPLNDSIGAFNGSDVNGPTALINSVLKLPHTLAIGTPVFNIRFSRELAMKEQGREAIKNLIKRYFMGGGLQIQVTVLSSDEMRAAQKEPDKYKDLIVRIGGYSEFFVYLSPALQESVISRSEY